jgi:ABC-type glycerol-3-phosphate transport system substrate-binding protein
MKKIMLILSCLALVSVSVFAGGNKDGQTLTALAIGNPAGDGLKAIAREYAKTHPGFVLDITAIDGVTDFNTTLNNKIIAGDAPDIIYMQWDTGIIKFAQNGYLLPLDDLGLDSKIVDIKKPINKYNGKTYAYPGIQSIWGGFWNGNLAKKYGVDYIPSNIDETLAAFATIRANGLEYPFSVAGMDLSGAVAWIFAYMHQQISGVDPLFYLKLCEGQKSFDGPEIREMYNYYGKMLAYAAKDTVGLSSEEWQRRFAREETVMAIQGSGMTKNLRALNPNFEFILAPSTAVIDKKNAGIISDFDAALAISATTKKAELAKDFYKYVYEPSSQVVFVENINGISPVKAASPKYDKAIDINTPYIRAGNFVGFSERDWIPGIKDVLKKNTQDWMSGALPLDRALANLEAEHQRLIKATPAYVTEYRELLKTIGLVK